MTRSFLAPHGDIDHQNQLKYVRNLRTHHSELSLLMAKKLNALDHLEQLWHEAGLIRARSRNEEQFDSSVWKQYSAAVNVVKAINREVETLWQALLAIRRANDSSQVVTSTNKSADGRAQEATASHNAATDGMDRAQPSGTSPDRSPTKNGNLTAQGAAQVATKPKTCSDSKATERPASPELPLNHAHVRDHCLFIKQTATANTDTQPESARSHL